MRKEYNKLIRDRIPEFIAVNGQTAAIRTLTDAEYAAALEKKLNEETAEYLESKAPAVGLYKSLGFTVYEETGDSDGKFYRMEKRL